jgi:glycosyltransferase involved in cell wall biosynthesis
VIGAVGRFIPAKDYPLLIEAAASLKDSGYKFKLQILGDGPERANVSECISKLGVEDIVDLPGMVSDVSRWYREFDIYVSSSLREGQPVALLEAMAHRLPVVATNCGSIASTVGDQEGGLIVPPGDDRALASALAKLIDDAQLREKFGENARGRAEREFSVTAVAAEHTRLYEEILATKGLGGITESK